MKKNLILIIVLNVFLNCSFSQDVSFEDSIPISFEEQVEHLFEHVDLSQVPNGILYDHGIPLQPMEFFDGSLSENNKTDYSSSV